MKLLLSYPAGKKIESRDENGSVKIRELDSDNRDVERGISDESDTDKPLHY